MILYLNRQPNEELLEQLYAFTNRLEPSKLGIYLDVNREDADLIARTYDPNAGLAESKEEAQLLALAPGELWVKTGRPTKELDVAVLEQLGLKPTTLERLTWLNVKILGDLMAWSKAQLQRYLGDESKLVLPYLKGPFTTSLNSYTLKSYLMQTYTFSDPVTEPYQLWPVLEHLCQSLTNELGDQAASKLELTTLSQGLAFNAVQVAKQPITSTNLLTLAHQAFEDTGVLGLEVDRLALTLKGLYRPNEQGRLWHAKQRRAEAIAKVEKRFPGKLLQIVESDPYSLLPEFRHSLKSVAGSEVTRGAKNPDRNHSQRPAQNDRRSAHLVGA